MVTILHLLIGTVWFDSVGRIDGVGSVDRVDWIDWTGCVGRCCVGRCCVRRAGAPAMGVSIGSVGWVPVRSLDYWGMLTC